MRNRVPLAPNQTTKTTVESTAVGYKNDSEINKIQHVIHSVQPQIDEQRRSNQHGKEMRKYLNQSKRETHLLTHLQMLIFSVISLAPTPSAPL